MLAVSIYLSKLPVRRGWLTSPPCWRSPWPGSLEPGTSITVAADIEPSLLALGMNNRAWFYLLGETNVDLVADMQLNADYCAVRYEGSSTS